MDYDDTLDAACGHSAGSQASGSETSVGVREKRPHQKLSTKQRTTVIISKTAKPVAPITRSSMPKESLILLNILFEVYKNSLMVSRKSKISVKNLWSF